jgi:hypothetical protein
MCWLGDAMLMLDNVFSVMCVILTTIHILYYCRAIKFVGNFVLIVSGPEHRCVAGRR